MAGVDATGFVPKTQEEIEDDIVSRQKANIDTNLDTTADSLVGQVNGIISEQIAQVWEVGAEIVQGVGFRSGNGFFTRYPS